MTSYEKIFLNTIELIYQQSVSIVCTHSKVFGHFYSSRLNRKCVVFSHIL